MKELRNHEPDDYKNFLRVDGGSYDELLELVGLHIRKQDTVMRKAIPPAERLILTFRFLATGNAFLDLNFMTATSPQAIGEIVMETCNALIDCLQP